MPQPPHAPDPAVRLARYCDKEPSKEWILGAPGLEIAFRNRNSVDLVCCFGDFRTRGYTGHCGFWFVTSKIIERSLKRALIPEVGQIEVPKKGDPLLLGSVRVHTAVLLGAARIVEKPAIRHPAARP